MTGSSPLARGLPQDHYLRDQSCADHPRSRGVYGIDLETLPLNRGSSPLARGLLGVGANLARAVRIIPARAGFTYSSGPSSTANGDHPRSRGVYCRTIASVPHMAGSSPLARGLRSPRRTASTRPGIIPARAGFTPEQVPVKVTLRDHPRSRGVYVRGGASKASVAGSSPLARGLQGWGVPLWGAPRIIPARAGFTGACSPREPGHRDHPRSRGVYKLRRCRRFWLRGSSPLARGLRPPDLGADHRGRIIPARAGFTMCRCL